MQDDKVNCPEVAAFAIQDKQLVKAHLKDIKRLQREDAFLHEIKKNMNDRGLNSRDRLVSRYFKNYKMVNSRLVYTTGNNRTVLAVPNSLSEKLIHYVHQEIGHGGSYKTISAMKARYF